MVATKIWVFGDATILISHINHIGYEALRVLIVSKPNPPVAIHATIKQTEYGPKIIPRTHELAPIIDLNWKGRTVAIALVQRNGITLRSIVERTQFQKHEADNETEEYCELKGVIYTVPC